MDEKEEKGLKERKWMKKKRKDLRKKMDEKEKKGFKEEMRTISASTVSADYRFKKKI